MYLSTALKRIDLDCGRTMVNNTLIVRLPGSPAHTFFFFSKKGLKAGLDAFLDGFIVTLSCECVGCFK